MNESKKIMIAAAGTGGHVFPGLAVANYLQAHGWTVTWLGTEKGRENAWVHSHYPIDTLSIGGLRGKNWKTLCMAPYKIAQAIHQAIRYIGERKPDLILVMGGFVSGPIGVAAKLCGVPLIVHEQNAIPGLTNRILALWATRICESFPDTLRGKHVVLTGNPVRTSIEQLPSPTERFAQREGPIRILVLGGSLGAQAINEVMPTFVKQAQATHIPVEVWHQTGEAHWKQTQAAYESAGLSVHCLPFIEDMAKAYAWADLVICRAGALTIAEIIAVGLPAIFIPYPFAVDDHQTYNAQALVDAQSALLLPQTELTADRLLQILENNWNVREALLRRACAAWRLNGQNATQAIAKQCEEIFYA